MSKDEVTGKIGSHKWSGTPKKESEKKTISTLPKKILQLAEKYGVNYTAENLSKMTKLSGDTDYGLKNTAKGGISGQEKKVSYLIKKLMEEAKFDEVKIDPIGNVIGQIGNGKRILVFDGHIDVVGNGNDKDWKVTTSQSGEIKKWEKEVLKKKKPDGEWYVWGRGTSDQRGGVAAFITAGKILKELAFDGDLTIFFVGSVMEEDCDGLCWKYILDNLDKEDSIIKKKPDLVISTESTEGKIYRGHRGRMEIEVKFKGESCHASAPHRGHNAIYDASRFCLEIENLNEKLIKNVKDKKSEFLTKGTIAVTEFISESPSLCAVSDYCKVHLDRRMTYGETEESSLKEVDEVLKELEIKDYKINVPYYPGKAFTGKKIGMKKYYPTWIMPEDHDYVEIGKESFKELYGKDVGIYRWTFSTNCVCIKGMHDDIHCLGFGPGLEEEAHSPDEKCSISSLIEASAFYVMLAYKFAKFSKK